jgi:small-conductance mechanosensitive channel
MRLVRGLSLVAVAGLLLASGIHGQTPAPSQPAPPDPYAAAIATATKDAQPSGRAATLVFANRSVVVFRATVLTREPSVRAAAAVEQLNGLVEQDPRGRVWTRTYPDAVLVGIGDRPVFVVFAADVDPLAGESLAGKGSEAAARLEQAFGEAVELRTPSRFLAGVGFAIVATLIYGLAVFGLIRLDRRVAAAASRAVERRLEQMSVGEIMTRVRAPLLLRRLVALGAMLTGLLLTYSWVAAVLRRFPYTRPWGESLRTGLLSAVTAAGLGIVAQLPNLLTVLAIVLVTRFIVRLVNVAFAAVGDNRVSLPGVYPETAEPTRRIVIALLWIFALIVSYKYLPGSDSEVFKGASVFVGLVVSLGSTGVMNQVMSGLMVTYSRAVRLGDFVRIGEIEGTVTQLGTLSTKVRTPRNEEITIPNAVVVSHATVNYSRHADSDGLFAATSVTIGYDVAWRQVHALLLMAAERTPGVRQQPKPIVLQTALCDFYVQYTLLVPLENPARRLPTLDAVHANIQDAFNEYGVQIMSPNYEADPSDRKVVPRARWYAEPAVSPEGAGVAPVAPGARPVPLDRR